MNKAHIYVSLALSMMVLINLIILYKKNREDCQCVKYKQISQKIIHQDGTFESSVDSICVIGGNKNGDLIIVNFK